MNPWCNCFNYLLNYLITLLIFFMLFRLITEDDMAMDTDNHMDTDKEPEGAPHPGQDSQKDQGFFTRDPDDV